MPETLDDPITTGGAGWPKLERVTPDDVHNILADKVQFDANGMGADHYTLQLGDRDFFDTLTFQMQRQILCLIEKSIGVGYQQVRDHLDYEIKSLLGVEE